MAWYTSTYVKKKKRCWISGLRMMRTHSLIMMAVFVFLVWFPDVRGIKKEWTRLLIILFSLSSFLSRFFRLLAKVFINSCIYWHMWHWRPPLVRSINFLCLSKVTKNCAKKKKKKKNINTSTKKKKKKTVRVCDWNKLRSSANLPPRSAPFGNAASVARDLILLTVSASFRRVWYILMNLVTERILSWIAVLRSTTSLSERCSSSFSISSSVESSHIWRRANCIWATVV